MICLKTVTMQLIDGEPDGIRICRVEGESLTTVVIPRDKLSEAKSLPGIPLRGIYYLLDENHGNLSKVYAGQTTRGINRLDAHRTQKLFWNKAVMFLDKSVNIDRDILDALEAKSIDFITSHGSYETDNAAVPSSPINPYKEELVEQLHKKILFRMSVLGYNLGRVNQETVSATPLFYTKKNGIRGVGCYNGKNGHFTVHIGSQVNLSKKIIKNNAVAQVRNRLFGNAKGVVTLEENLEFSSPSAAAVFVLGGSQNGWTEWEDDKGQTLNHVYRNNKQ